MKSSAHFPCPWTLMMSLTLLLASSPFLNAQTPAAAADTARQQQRAPHIEHLAINVADPLAVAKWYTEHLGFAVLRQGPAPQYSTMIADSARNMALELYHNAEHPLLSPDSIHHMSMHLAFSADSLAALRDRLLKAGARVAEDLKTSASGDRVLTMRDPWGFALQFVERAKPLLPKWKGLFIEHYALNVDDSRAKSKWLADNLGMAVVREGKAPSYGMFLSDAPGSLMMELYQDKKYPVVKMADVDYMSTHLAFAVSDVAAAKARLVASGATVAEEMKQLPNGDWVLMLRDPWGEPLQIVKRVQPLLP